MKKSVTAVMRLTEISDRLAVLDKVETRSSAEDTELAGLETERTTVNKEYREAANAEAQVENDLRRHPHDFHVTPETREKLELRGRSRYGRMLAASLLGRQLDGAEVEYKSSLGIVDGIPLDLFEGDRPEVRADAATTAPAAASGSQVSAWSPYIFADSIAQSELNIDMPAAGSGAWIEPGFSTALTAGAKAKSVNQDSTAAVVTGLTAKPARVAARMTIGLEDIYSIGSDEFEDALRQQARGRAVG